MFLHITSFQKILGLYALTTHILEKILDVTLCDAWGKDWRNVKIELEVWKEHANCYDQNLGAKEAEKAEIAREIASHSGLSDKGLHDDNGDNNGDKKEDKNKSNAFAQDHESYDDDIIIKGY